jgi:hypothetical protein
MASGVEHHPDPRLVAISWLVWSLGTAASKHPFDGSAEVFHENLEVHHLRLLPVLLRPRGRFVCVIGLEVQSDATI